MAQRFSFWNACFHFANTDGPPGFVWKYLVSYVLGAVCLTGISYVIFSPLINIWLDVAMDAMGGRSEAEIEAILARRATEIIGWIVFGYALMILLGILYWAVFEAAAQRRYVRDEGFRLRLGGDELRLVVVGLIWFVFSIGAYILSAVLVGVSTASLVMALDNPAGGALVILLGILLVGFVWLWIAIRLAPSSAMTVRDRRITFFNAWGATKGRFWTLLGAYIVLVIIITFAAAVLYTLVGTGVAAAVWANVERFEQAADNPMAMFSAILQFDILAPILAGWLMWIGMQGLFALMWAGPAALAAKTDPRGGGVAQAPDVFA